MDLESTLRQNSSPKQRDNQKQTRKVAERDPKAFMTVVQQSRVHKQSRCFCTPWTGSKTEVDKPETLLSDIIEYSDTLYSPSISDARIIEIVFTLKAFRSFLSQCSGATAFQFPPNSLSEKMKNQNTKNLQSIRYMKGKKALLAITTFTAKTRQISIQFPAQAYAVFTLVCQPLVSLLVAGMQCELRLT